MAHVWDMDQNFVKNQKRVHQQFVDFHFGPFGHFRKGQKEGSSSKGRSFYFVKSF